MPSTSTARVRSPRLGACLLAAVLTAGPAPYPAPPPAPSESVPTVSVPTVRAPSIPQTVFKLANGLQFVLVERQSSTNVAAGWVVHSGSAADPPGSSGVAHLLEHLLLKGSRTVGTRDFHREQPLLEEADRLHEALRLTPPDQTARAVQELRVRLSEIEDELRRLTVPGELSLLYSEAGATGLRARTFEDFTMQSIELPAEALELWFWLESDRLLEPVVRELRSEIATIAEERRQRAAAEPGAEFTDRLRAALWGEHSYGLPVLGNQPDLEGLSRSQVHSELQRRYRPEAITAVLAGRFDRELVEGWARTYFGRLAAGRSAQPAAREQTPSTHLSDSPIILDLPCEGCTPQVEIAYRTPAIGEPDSVALELLAGLLNGRGGRLYREWVVDRRIARSAHVIQHPRALGGSFRLRAEAATGVPISALEAAWSELVGALGSQPLLPGELERVRARIGRESFERLKEPRRLVEQLLTYHGLGQPERLNSWATQLSELAEPQVGQAVRRHLDRPTVIARYYSGSAAPQPGEPDR